MTTYSRQVRRSSSKPKKSAKSETPRSTRSKTSKVSPDRTSWGVSVISKTTNLPQASKKSEAARRASLVKAAIGWIEMAARLRATEQEAP